VHRGGPASSFWSQSPSLSLAHLLMPFSYSKPQQIKLLDATRGRRRLRPLFPVASGRERRRRSRFQDHHRLPHVVHNSIASGSNCIVAAVRFQCRSSPPVTKP
jgi:hypothetical protein